MPVVLVADDDPILRLLARETLEQAGYSVIEAADGAEALKAFQTALPDLVLLDVNMPEADGFEVCASLRRAPASAHTPILMMTAPEDTETIHLTYEAGATDFVTKPINWALLGYRIRYALRDTARSLLEATRAISATLDLPEVLRRTTREIVRAVAADTGGAWLLTPDKSGFVPMAAYRAPKNLLQQFVETVYPGRGGLVEWAEAEAHPIFVAASHADPRLTHPLFRLIPHQSLLLVPLREDGAIVGAIVAAWTRAPYRATQDEIRLAEALAYHAENAITNARLHAVIRSRDQQLRHSQKMEAVGRLAGGIAHDFNNILGVVLGQSELLLASSGLTGAQRRRVQATITAIDRAVALTQQLLAFSRRQIVQPRLVDLNGVVQGVARMLERLLGEDVKLVVTTEPALGRVKADAGQLDQVVMNLAINARDAMPQGGCLTLETANVEVSAAAALHTPDASPGSYVLLAVHDTGAGMDEHVLTHLFEPFFTTKESGKGTGLGLATVHGIVSGAGGFIRVTSAVGGGSTFEIYLPRVEAGSTASTTATPDVGREPPRGAGTVLVVEDEVALRSLVQELLRERGYEVLEARDGVEALELVRAHTAPISLLLTDVVMPRMNGVALAQQVRAERPDARILYMSGHTENETLRQAMSEPSAAFILKPFTRHALASKVREVLDAGHVTIPQGGPDARVGEEIP